MEQQNIKVCVGSTLTGILFVNGRPKAIFARVVSEAPLYLETDEQSLGELTFPRSILLLWHEGDQLMKGEGSAMSLVVQDGISTIEVRDVTWHDLERRKFPRFNVSVPCMMRAVQEVRGEVIINVIPGTTEDLSLGGTWVSTEAALESGTLVEFQACVAPGEYVRMLGVVAHYDNERQGFGLAFLDYVGPSKRALHDMLLRAS